MAQKIHRMRSSRTLSPGLLMLAVLVSASGCGTSTPSPAPSTPETPATAGTDIEQSVRQFCGNCHAEPRPDSFPKDAWLHEVRRGFEFYFESGRSDLKVPVLADVAKYYRELAPETLELSTSGGREPSGLFRLVTDAANAGEPDQHSVVSFVAEYQTDDLPSLWMSDMKSGVVSLVSTTGRTLWSHDSLVMNPAVIRVCDLDGDSHEDLLCTDLGSFPPEDHDRGRLVWVRNRGMDSENVVTLLDGVGRLADVRVADFNMDGRPDLAVAEFGWHKTGGIHLMLNATGDQTTPAFERVLLDNRPGTIHLLITDLNEDQRPDIIAIVSQEYEQVMAYINVKSGFLPTLLYAAPDPAYGSSGLSMVDFDGDGDEDLLYTNGDTFDSFIVKPYHGVAWLENQGDLKFVHHHIASMPGIHRALASDFDLDGDLDIAAVASLPKETLNEVGTSFDAVIWLEQKAPGKFERHVISTETPIHVAMELTDFDKDGDTDIVAANFDPSVQRPAFLVFANQTVTSPGER